MISLNRKEIASRYGGLWRFPQLVDFHFLVNPYFPTNAIIDDIQRQLPKLLQEYPSGLKVQNQLAAEVFRVPANSVVVGNGASEIIKSIGTCFHGTFGIFTPSFDEYVNSVGAERFVCRVSKKRGAAYNVEDLISLSKQCDNLVVVNPDNPSGNFIPRSEMVLLLDYLYKNNKNLIVDESFIDFSDNGQVECLLHDEIIQKYPNLFLIKSIGKSFAVPGLRLGVLVTSNQETLLRLSANLSIWNINSIGEYFLQIFDRHREEYEKACLKVIAARKLFFQQLESLPSLTVFPSQANYLMCELVDGLNVEELDDYLFSKLFFIKNLKGKPGCSSRDLFRLTVRTPDENSKLVLAISEFIKK
jgi:histidinol-phosphate/aromatic aminotransferase/cobyric acid decarboxylase-like protein